MKGIMTTVFTVIACSLCGYVDDSKTIETLQTHLVQSLENSRLGKSALNEAILNIEGMSSAKNRHFLMV